MLGATSSEGHVPSKQRKGNTLQAPCHVLQAADNENQLIKHEQAVLWTPLMALQEKLLYPCQLLCPQNI